MRKLEDAGVPRDGVFVGGEFHFTSNATTYTRYLVHQHSDSSTCYAVALHAPDQYTAQGSLCFSFRLSYTLCMPPACPDMNKHAEVDARHLQTLDTICMQGSPWAAASPSRCSATRGWRVVWRGCSATPASSTTTRPREYLFPPGSAVVLPSVSCFRQRKHTKQQSASTVPYAFAQRLARRTQRQRN